nr:DUF1016 N-terminal domain-containing protein [Pleurocapsa sp. PCC 7319]
MSELNADNYGRLLGEIKQHIRSAQYEALKAVNQKLIALYWKIGKSIVTRQQGETWGKSVVEQLAKDLQQEFPGISGFLAGRIIWYSCRSAKMMKCGSSTSVWHVSLDC